MACKALQLQDYFQLIDTAVDYGNGQTKTLKYNSWGKLTKAVSTDGDTRIYFKSRISWKQRVNTS
ncbi:MAG: hypothetical protein KOO69_07365 [Victivallales bacterium]|nr:hypothetical protein [Victivallales bacterium]